MCEVSDAVLDVRGVGEHGGPRDRAHVVCEKWRLVDAAVCGAVAPAFLVGAPRGAAKLARGVAAEGAGGLDEQQRDLAVVRERVVVFSVSLLDPAPARLVVEVSVGRAASLAAAEFVEVDPFLRVAEGEVSTVSSASTASTRV